MNHAGVGVAELPRRLLRSYCFVRCRASPALVAELLVNHPDAGVAEQIPSMLVAERNGCRVN